MVVFPQVITGALIIGGRGGTRRDGGAQPGRHLEQSGVRHLGGANFGFQWGVQSTELVLVLMSRQSVEGIAGGKVTLGADASVAAGPIGRSATAATDATFKAQVLGYARNAGLFAGVALDGSVISIDDDSERLRLRRVGHPALADPRGPRRQSAAGGARIHRGADPRHQGEFGRGSEAAGRGQEPERRIAAGAGTDAACGRPTPQRPTRWKIPSPGRAAAASSSSAADRRPRSARAPCRTRLGEPGPDASGRHEMAVSPLMMNCTPMQIIRKPISRVSATMPVAPSTRLEAFRAAQRKPRQQRHDQDAGRHAEEIREAVPALARARLRREAHHHRERAGPAQPGHRERREGDVVLDLAARRDFARHASARSETACGSRGTRRSCRRRCASPGSRCRRSS